MTGPSTAELDRRNRAALKLIRTMWPAMLELLTPVPGSIARPSTPRSLYTRADEDQLEDDLPRTEVVLALRQDTLTTLSTWAREVITRRRITATVPRRHGPDLCRFLERHSTWLTGQADARNFTEAVEHHARQIRDATFPPPRDGLWIGDCPNTIGVEGVPVECGTPVRVRSHNPGNIKCPGCGLTDTLDGWVLRIVGTEGPFTAAQLVPILHRRLGIVVTETAIRQWVRRGWIEPVKRGFTILTDDAGRYYYDARDVTARLIARDVLRQQ